MKNLGQFLQKYATEYNDRIAYEIKRGFRTQRFTFLEVYSLALKTATFLHKKGVKKGDKIAIWASNMPEYPILYFGCWLLGVVAVPIDVRTTKETVKVFLTKAKCSLGFKGKFIPESFKGLVKESFCLEDLVDLVKNLSPSATFEVEPHDLAEIAFTSGTTGTPKGVMLTHGNFLSDVKALTRVFPFKKEYRALSLLPLSHAFEQVVDFLALFKTGIKVTYLERINRLTIINGLKKGKISSVALVPQALQLLMSGIENEVERQQKQKLWQMLNRISPRLPIWVRRLLFKSLHHKLGGHLIFFGCGSAPLNLRLAKKWENLGIEIFEGYGATETTAVLTINAPLVKRLGCVGKVLPGIKLRLDEKTREILAKGPTISPGYFQDQEKTKEAFVVYPDKGGSWYKTGDIGEFDRDGFLYITGREAFRIVLSSGQKVYPEDIEKKLNRHLLVGEACVVGAKREDGEVVYAFVITKHANKLDKIIKDVNAELSSHEQILEYSLWEGEDFPRTPLLKIDRKKVLERVGLKKEREQNIGVKTYNALTNIIAQIARVERSKIKGKATLSTDLKLDSLSRVELVSRIEEELAVSIDELKIGPQTTVEDIEKLIKEAPLTTMENQYHRFIFSKPFTLLRLLLQEILVFPLFRLFVSLKVQGKEHIKNLKGPVIYYFNHIGIYDGLQVLRILPRTIREKLAIPVSIHIWKDYRWMFVETFAGAFPFDKEKKIKASLELLGEFLDNGYSILMSPEGTFSKDGRLLEFKEGAGFMAVGMGVPVVPIKIDPSYREIFPPMNGRLVENLPKKREQVRVTIGKPIFFPKDTAYTEATRRMRNVMEEL